MDTISKRGMEHKSQEAPRPPRVLLLCSPCMGHLIPFVELARRLVAGHGLAATLLFATATPTPSEEYLEAAAAVPEGVDLVALPAPPAHALPPSASVPDRIAYAVASGAPRVVQLARSLAASALVIDTCGMAARGVLVEEELGGVPVYMFFTSPWTLLSLHLHLPELDAAITGEYRDMTEPIRLPGCVPIVAADLPTPLLANRSSVAYARYLAGANGYPKLDGFIVNTLPELEPAVADGVRGLKVPVHAVGPLIWTRHCRHKCLTWLDRQPHGSVVYVSFGSCGTLTWQQTAELALGLEMSRHRFVWVVRRPSENPLGCGSFLGTQRGMDEALDFLPGGFVERTRGTGLLVPSWAPQTSILSHPSIGCFVTHCGWNSVLEGLLNGIPMVAWPLYAEQKINAAMLEGQLGVATRVQRSDGGLVCKEEVARAIECAMEYGDGETLRNKIHKLKDKVLDALNLEEASLSSCTSSIFKFGETQ